MVSYADGSVPKVFGCMFLLSYVFRRREGYNQCARSFCWGLQIDAVIFFRVNFVWRNTSNIKCRRFSSYCINKTYIWDRHIVWSFLWKNEEIMILFHDSIQIIIWNAFSHSCSFLLKYLSKSMFNTQLECIDVCVHYTTWWNQISSLTQRIVGKGNSRRDTEYSVLIDKNPRKTKLVENICSSLLAVEKMQCLYFSFKTIEDKNYLKQRKRGIKWSPFASNFSVLK